MLSAKRILVIRYRFIGDTILTVPFLKNLRLAYPEAQIDVLVGPQSGKVLEGCPYINELISYDTTRFHKYDRGEGNSRSYFSYVSELRKRNYDTAFVLKRSLSAALLPLLLGCRNRIGYAGPPLSLLLSHAVKWNPKIHEVESTLDLLKVAGIKVEDTSLEAWLTDKEKAEVLELVPELKSRGLKVLFHAAAAHPDKTYPLKLWAELISALKAKFDIEVFFTGSEQDIALYKELEQLSGVSAVNTAGKLSLRQSMALLSCMNLSICTDSGPAHLSAASGTPTLALFGPTDPERWAPWGKQHKAIFKAELSCRPCNYKMSCSARRECLTELAPSMVQAEAELLLRRLQNKESLIQQA